MRQRQRRGLAKVLLEVIFPQTAIVVIIVATTVAACGKRHPRVTRSFRSHIGMAFNAKVDGHRVAFTVRPGRPMLGMACHATSGVEFRELRGITRIVEFGFGMRIGRFTCLRVTLQTSVVRYSTKWRMAGIARHFDLVMPVRSGSGQIDRLVL